MDLRYQADEIAFRDDVRSFVRDHLPPDIHAKVENGIELMRDDFERWMRILSAKGWIATNWEKTDGGPGLTPAEKFMLEGELLLGGAPRLVHFGTRMVGPVLLAYGTAEQKQKYLPKILTSEEIWCQGYSEPGAGSDLASLQCRAVRDGDHYVVNGTKVWTSYAHCADRMFALVRTSREKKQQDGITVLLIDLKAPGVNVRPLITIDGRHHFNQEYFDNVRVAVADRVGAEGEGWKIAKYLLGHERSNNTGVMMAKRVLDKVGRIAEEERVGGAPLCQDADFRRRFTEVRIELEALEMTAFRVLASASADQPVGSEASVLKYKMAIVGQAVNELLLEVGAYYGMPLEGQTIRGQSNAEAIGPDYLYRMSADYYLSRGSSIAGGSNEIQKNIIAKRVLDLP